MNRLLKNIIIVMIAGLLLASCSRAYEPINVPKKKGRCNSCSRF